MRVGRNLPAALLALQQGVRAGDLPLAPPRPGVTFIRHAREIIVSMEEIVSVSMNGATLPRTLPDPRPRLTA